MQVFKKHPVDPSEQLRGNFLVDYSAKWQFHVAERLVLTGTCNRKPIDKLENAAETTTKTCLSQSLFKKLLNFN